MDLLDELKKRWKPSRKQPYPYWISELIILKIADIAAKAMVSQVSIYNYYGSKDKVIKAAFERLMNNQIQCLEKLIETDMPFKEKLEQLLTFKKQTINHLNIYKYSSQDTQFIQFLSSLYSKSSPLFIRFIQMGKKSGDIEKMLVIQL